MNHLPTQNQFKIHQLPARQQALTTLSSPHRPISNRRMTRIQNHRVHMIEMKENRMLHDKAAGKKISIFFPWIISNLHMNQ